MGIGRGLRGLTHIQIVVSCFVHEGFAAISVANQQSKVKRVAKMSVTRLISDSLLIAIFHDQMIETNWNIVGKQQLYHSWKSRMSIRESGSDTIVKVSQHLEVLVFAECQSVKIL